MSEWQPIKTAPRDGRKILVFEPKEEIFGGNWVDVVFWGYNGHARGWLAANDEHLSCDHPTHWMPLPDPPSAVGGGLTADVKQNQQSAARITASGEGDTR